MLAAVSEILFLDGRSDLYVTCVVAMVDTQQHTMVYANAGHPPGVMLGKGAGTHALGVGGPPLGLFAAAHYDEERITLASGDLVVLVSDGITDAIDASGDDIPTALRAELDEPAREDAGTGLQGAPRHGSPIAWSTGSHEVG